jgi:pyridoxine 4-dehydrogenase
MAMTPAEGRRAGIPVAERPGNAAPTRMETRRDRSLYAELAGYRVPRLAMGCMALAIEGRPGSHTAVDTIHAALDAGVRYLDTAWSYYLPGRPGTGGPGERGYGERLVHDALATWDGPRDEVLIATKTGWLRTLDSRGAYGWKADARPQTIIAQAKESAMRLNVDCLSLLYSHCDDPALPYADQMGAFRQLLDEGVVGHVGISRVGNDDIDIARSILGTGLVAVQNQFSPSSRDAGHTMGHCADLGLAFVCYSPLGGFLDSCDRSAYTVFQQIAALRDVSCQQVVLAWELSRHANLFTIPSARNPFEARDCFAAQDLVLTDKDLALLERGTVLSGAQ